MSSKCLLSLGITKTRLSTDGLFMVEAKGFELPLSTIRKSLHRSRQLIEHKKQWFKHSYLFVHYDADTTTSTCVECLNNKKPNGSVPFGS